MLIIKNQNKDQSVKSEDRNDLIELYEESISVTNELIAAVDDEDREAQKTIIEKMKVIDQKIKEASVINDITAIQTKEDLATFSVEELRAKMDQTAKDIDCEDNRSKFKIFKDEYLKRFSNQKQENNDSRRV